MNTVITTALLSLFTVLAGPGSSASNPDADSGHRGKRGHGQMCEKLECTDAQKAEIQAIRAALKADTQDERAEAKTLREAFKAAKSAQTPDPELIANLRAQMDALRASMKEARQESQVAVAAVLTPAQKEKLAAMKAAHKAEHKGKRGKGDGKGKRGKGEGKHAGKGGPDGKGKRSTMARAEAPTNG